MNERRNNFGRKTEKTTSRKLKSRVDLTAMVSISFLLIIFFMVTKELSKPQALFLGMNESSCGPISCFFGGDRFFTLLLDDNDRIVSYSGFPSSPEASPKELKYGKEGIRKELLNKNLQAQAYSGDPRKGLIVIIKPSKKSNFTNLVDVLDEMNITKITTYMVVDDFSTEESKLLAIN
ncbi:biopolymer transporter ExbD [Flavobacterium sp.]|uniref:ExbD/TolR family protein n=1 Tax=Flavobacterium sp. TaxID=239 RepID=UPI00286E32C5|nr:biopolymer transporter ExbD [Flavobacterium sp.]